MARFHDKVGYGNTEETPPNSGIFEDVITEVPYYGDVLQKSRRSDPGDGVNNDIRVGNSISIVADQYAVENFSKILYVHWEGAYWEVTSVNVASPRLILNLGPVYNGPKLDGG